uniref:Mitoguardin n=1 Tax=Trichuris muris TaxID=70415 RepID=A0A5S6R3G1_TRIMR
MYRAREGFDAVPVLIHCMATLCLSAVPNECFWIRAQAGMKLAEAFAKLAEYKKAVIALAAAGVLIPGLIMYLRRRRRRRITYEDIFSEERVTAGHSASSEVGRHCLYCHCQRRRLISNCNSTISEIQAVSCSSLMHGGMQSLIKAIHSWERACELVEQADRPECGRDPNLSVQLRDLLQTSYKLCDSVSHILIFCPTFASSSAGLMGADSGNSISSALDEPENAMSVFSDESYFSAFEEIVEPIETEPTIDSVRDGRIGRMLLYYEALARADMGEVVCRKLRTEAVGCESDKDFMAKLDCIRKASEIVFEDRSKRAWLASSVEEILCCMLKQADRDDRSFRYAYNALTKFWIGGENDKRIAAELEERKVPVISFYDVVSDFILLDALDEMAHPPGAIAAIVRNPLLPSKAKENVLASIASSVIVSKRNRVMEDGFLALFYNVMETVAPVLAWSLLGSDDKLRELFSAFRNHIITFHSDIFNENVVRFTSAAELAEDIWATIQRHVAAVHARLTPREAVMGNSIPTTWQIET